uniref:Uncharacterized protein n=1 Tax=Daphnia galeata TaxID=27404 RepID=A0A8J2RL39_9CRUS|nr:unnamed protein product [Daphnia galeata]
MERTTNSYASINRGTCCLPVDLLEDFCGRSNCTLPACSHRSSNFFSEQMKTVGYYGRAFCIETSGSVTLNFRQACSVECRITRYAQSQSNSLCHLYGRTCQHLNTS